MSAVEKSPMWQIAAEAGLYRATVPMEAALAFTAGMYAGGIMAGMELLIGRGHCVSEAVNEQLIEATDSLMPYMDKNGLRAMVDGCSITARLGTRKWGPVAQRVLTEALASPPPSKGFEAFLESPLHRDIEACFALRPTVKLIVS